MAAFADCSWLKCCFEGTLKLRLKRDRPSNSISIGDYDIDRKNIITIHKFVLATIIIYISCNIIVT